MVNASLVHVKLTSGSSIAEIIHPYNGRKLKTSCITFPFNRRHYNKRHYTDDNLNGNHVSTPCSRASSAEICNSFDDLKFSEYFTSPGPRMGVNIFSYPRLPGLSKTSLSLKISKDLNLSWGSKKSSPLSAPVCSSAPRMGISGVEKSNISLSETNSLDYTFHQKSDSIKTGICSSCRSQSFSKDASSSAEFSQYSNKITKKKVHISNEKLLSSDEKLFLNTLQSNENMKISLKEKISFKSLPNTNLSLRKTASNNELRRSIVNASPTKETGEAFITPQREISPVYTQSTPDTGGSYLDRASPRLIDDTPSDDEVPISISLNGRNSQSNFFSPSYFQKPSNIANPVQKSVPPLATAESDSDSNIESAVKYLPYI